MARNQPRQSLISPGSMLSASDVPDLQSRIIASDAAKHRRRSPSIEEGLPQADESASQQTEPNPANKEDAPDRQSYKNITSHITDNMTVLPDGLSGMRHTILQAVRQGSQPSETLKTVTIKLPPSLDRQVEVHCHETGRKKQEVIRDALLLYFEAIEEALNSETAPPFARAERDTE